MSDYEQWTIDEVAEWPGASVTFEKASKHRKAILSFDGSTRFAVFPDSPSDSRRGVYNHLATVRAELAAMGAVRNERTKSTRPPSERNPGADEREVFRHEPAPVIPNPWQALVRLSGGALITKPGFYPNLTPEDYFAEPCPAPALTNSGIKMLLASCPAKFAHFHPAIGGNADTNRTEALDTGSLVHRLALDKGDDYAISPHDEFRTKDAKAWRDEARAAGQIVVKRKDFEEAEAMAAIIRDAIAAETRGHDYQTEVVIAWRTVVCGFPIWCRAMLDVWCPALDLAIDVKTCMDASDKAINRAFSNGYAHQAAFYSDGIEALHDSVTRPRFRFLFVEKDDPHLARSAEPSQGFKDGARIAIDRGAELFARCMKTGEWPGYQPYTAQPPAWWLSEISDIELLEAAE